MILERVAAYLLCAGILGLAYLQRRHASTWATPGALFCGLWFIYIALPLVALYRTRVDALSIAYILAACAAFSAPTFLVPWRAVLRRNAALATSRQHILKSPSLRLCFVASAAISLVLIAIDLRVQGVGLSEMRNDFFASSNELYARRNAGRLQSNLFGSAGLVLAYVAATLGGLIRPLLPAKRTRAIAIALALSPSLAIMLASGAKGTFLLGIVLVFGGTLLHRLLRDERPHVDVSATAYQSHYVALAVPFLTVAFLQRGLYTARNANLVDRLMEYFGSYAFMHLYGWSDWFRWTTGQSSEQEYSEEQVTAGYLTFKALFDAVGRAQEVPPGVYGEYLRLEGGLSSNVYTMFRGLVTDFGLLGSLAVLSGIGLLFTFGFATLLSRRRSLLGVAIFVLFIQFAYSSFIASPFLWNSTFIVPILVAGILAICSHNGNQGHCNPGGELPSKPQPPSSARTGTTLVTRLQP